MGSRKLIFPTAFGWDMLGLGFPGGYTTHESKTTDQFHQLLRSDPAKRAAYDAGKLSDVVAAMFFLRNTKTANDGRPENYTLEI